MSCFRLFWLGLLLGLLAACSNAPVPPSVILITLDTVRSDALGCYGSPTSFTPALDRIAREGVRFAQAYSASGVTPVSHASILTGRYPKGHGLRVMAGNSGYTLDSGVPSLASSFQSAGYRTAAIQSAFPVSRTFGLHQGFEVFLDLQGSFENQAEQGAQWNVAELQRRSDETTRLAIEFIEKSEAPFFLWIHYWDPHDTGLMPPSEFLKSQAERLPKLSENDQRYQAAVYALEVSYEDTQIAKLWQALETKGLWENTLIAVTSDHGEGLIDGLQDHGWYFHRMHYEEQLHVPLLVRGPGVPQGQVVGDAVSNVSLASTLLQLAGLPPNPECLTPLNGAWDPKSPAIEPGYYAEQLNGFDHNAALVVRRPDAAFLYTICDGTWKLTYRPHLPIEASELFHLERDPRELHNRIQTEPEVLRRLAEKLLAENPWVWQPFEGAGMAAGASATLGQLGYSESQSSGSLSWWWQCPFHPDQEFPERGRCTVDGCKSPLLPRNDWKLAPRPK